MQDNNEDPQLEKSQSQPIVQKTASQATTEKSIPNPGKGLGIASLVVSFFIGLIGIILGIVGLIKSKKSGHDNVLAVIGIIVGSIQMLAVGLVMAILIISYNNYLALAGGDNQNYYDYLNSSLSGNSKTTASLTDYPEKTLIAENYDYAIYVLDVNTTTDYYPKVDGKVLVYSKHGGSIVISNDNLNIVSMISGYTQQNDKYFVIWTGTNVIGSKTIVNLENGSFYNIGDAVAGSDLMYWNNYYIYSYADYSNSGNPRVADGGESFSVGAINLSTGEKKTILQSGLLTDYFATKLRGDSLVYEETTYSSVGNFDNPTNVNKTIYLKDIL